MHALKCPDCEGPMRPLHVDGIDALACRHRRCSMGLVPKLWVLGPKKVLMRSQPLEHRWSREQLRNEAIEGA